MKRLRPRFHVAMSLLVLLGAGAAAAPPPTLTPEQLQEWGRAVATHEPGQFDQAAFAIAKWPPERLYGLFIELKLLSAFQGNPRVQKTSPKATMRVSEVERDLALTPDEVRTGNINRILIRAALLHTDVEVVVLKGSTVARVSPFSGRYSITMQDGGDVGVGGTAVHLEFASWLLDGVRPDPSGDDDVRLWYQAVIAGLERQRRRGDAEWLLARALRIFPLDARLLFYSGAVDEMMATPSVQMALSGSRNAPRVSVFGGSPAQQKLQSAAGLFRRALAADPEFDEARLHLGRVTGLLGSHEPAAADLRQVAARFADETLLYYTALFLGREEDQLGHDEAARASFERASALYPRAQSALLAMSEMARRAGDSPGAFAVLERLLALPPDESARADPWWEYETSHVRDADARLSAWRARFPQGSPR